MTIENCKAGLDILIAHGATGHTISAEHDVFYAGDARLKIPLSERRKLRKLGWLIDKESDSWFIYT